MLHDVTYNIAKTDSGKDLPDSFQEEKNIWDPQFMMFMGED